MILFEFIKFASVKLQSLSAMQLLAKCGGDGNCSWQVQDGTTSSVLQTGVVDINLSFHH